MQRSSSLQKSQSSKHLVGSIHSGNLNYHHEMHAFNSNLVPAKAKEAVELIRNLTSADILGLRPHPWNKSTYMDRSKHYCKPLVPPRKGSEIKMSLKAQKSMNPRPNKIYPGTETRDYFGDWNISNYMEPKEMAIRLEEL